MEQLNDAEKARFEKIIMDKQVSEFMRLYNNLVDHCFRDCVDDFTSNKLSSNENTCISKCAKKYIKFNERAGQRFAEYNASIMNQRQ